MVTRATFCRALRIVYGVACIPYNCPGERHRFHPHLHQSGNGNTESLCNHPNHTQSKGQSGTQPLACVASTFSAFLLLWVMGCGAAISQADWLSQASRKLLRFTHPACDTSPFSRPSFHENLVILSSARLDCLSLIWAL